MSKRIWAILLWMTVVCGCGAQSGRSWQLSQRRVCAGVELEGRYGFQSGAVNTGIVIPGLGEDFVPQGIAWWEARNLLLISGYFRPAGQYSGVIAALDRTTGKMTGLYTLADGRGRGCGGHYGGVAVSDKWLHVVDGGYLHSVSLEQLERQGSRGVLRVELTQPLGLQGSACSYSEGLLWVAEYYEQTHYPLSRRQPMRTEDGREQHAWLVAYAVEEGGALRAEYAFSVPDRVQGVVGLPDGRILLSRSHGRQNPSVLTVCRDPRGRAPDRFVTVSGRIAPLWVLDEASGNLHVSAPPMAEGCCAVEGSVWLIFESAARYYREADKGSRDPTDCIWAYETPQ